ALPVVVAAIAGGRAPLGRRWRASFASIGLVAASAAIVHLTGGLIESHFHFFVVLTVILLYQDWLPFLLAIGFFVLEHGIGGALDPALVYNHPDAWAHPWKWALIHGAFVLAASVANIIIWREGERAHARTALILASVGEGIFGLDTHGRITFVNAAAAGM